MKKSERKEDPTIENHCKHMGRVNAIQNALMAMKINSVDDTQQFICNLRKEGIILKEV